MAPAHPFSGLPLVGRFALPASPASDLTPTKSFPLAVRDILKRQATTTVVAEPSDGNDGGTNLSGGEIAGIVIGSIVGVLLLFWIVRSCGMWGQPGLWGREPSPPPRRRHRGRSSHGHYRHQSTASRRRSPSHGRTSYEVRYSPNVMREKSRSPRRPDVVYDHRRGSLGRSRNYDYDY
ncbi:hypothetical protein VD0002_g5670 [Verticillium dahliae]|uniref:Uncharacterized protein n=2 Tax=Verticillium dahliae TaxID=27337 RepID=G2X0I5_VERDV|nr:uncharacterized protein VDAG_03764 [Verticillium dahliae VdLs.17]KAF3343825.1 hypothetical protein VdG2_07883 [Verticillium dahliae VDG2]KAH6678977.1 hypothetical protein EV126DRAFT_351423 [Verticillium dahliae]EGY22326.1 hypothetical protein VDAG_03764 [Verticillium dahliae VdLs.17]KAH6704724.1 hypothetical protein EV126DRAFT_440447 [Verticillium dahliae]PNH33507.1 hypothetical protein BJF96_g3143 [Verticillium dahliae]